MSVAGTGIAPGTSVQTKIYTHAQSTPNNKSIIFVTGASALCLHSLHSIRNAIKLECDFMSNSIHEQQTVFFKNKFHFGAAISILAAR